MVRILIVAFHGIFSHGDGPWFVLTNASKGGAGVFLGAAAPSALHHLHRGIRIHFFVPAAHQLPHDVDEQASEYRHERIPAPRRTSKSTSWWTCRR